MLNDDDRLTLAVESVFYETTIGDLVTQYRENLASGIPREDQLHGMTAALLGTELTRGQLASTAVMAVVMLAEHPAAV